MSDIGFRRDKYNRRNTTTNTGETMSMFAQPAAPSSGDNFDYKTHIGSLILIEPTEFVSQMETSFGAADAVKASVAVIDGPGTGEEYGDALLFGKVITGQLKRDLGSKVLGTLTQGERQPGKNPAWILAPATAEQVAKAEAWVAKKATSTVASAVAPF